MRDDPLVELSEDQHNALTCAVNVISNEDTRDRAEVKNEHEEHLKKAREL
jgi:hypothetical protein